MQGTDKADRIGAIASTLCAVHCAMTALLPAALAALGLGALLGPRAEWAFTLVAIAFASVALYFGWRRHRDHRVGVVLALGIVGLLASRGIESIGGHEHAHEQDEDDHGHAPETHQRDAHVDDDHEPAASTSDDDEHGGGLHGLGTLIGVLAGLTLVGGHVLNLRASRRFEDECCD